MDILAECPSCSASVKITPGVKMGEIIKCGVCKTDLEIIWLDPVELDFVYDPEDVDFDDSDDGDTDYYDSEEYDYESDY